MKRVATNLFMVAFPIVLTVLVVVGRVDFWVAVLFTLLRIEVYLLRLKDSQYREYS